MTAKIMLAGISKYTCFAITSIDSVLLAAKHNGLRAINSVNVIGSSSDVLNFQMAVSIKIDKICLYLRLIAYLRNDYPCTLELIIITIYFF